jgi:sugar phosphate isomerase/epimerase
MTPPIGATSYVFRYLLSDGSKAPGLDDLLRQARDAGLDSFQICENARPLNASPAEWTRLGGQAAGLGLHLSLGCMTLDPRLIIQYLDRVEAIGGSYLRVVLERQGEAPLTLDGIHKFLDGIIAELEARKICLAIENHFEIPSRVLADASRNYASNLVGFCVDVANSLRNFEDASVVLDLLGSRAICYHLKDYVVAGSNVGFNVSGAPFGEGSIGAPSLLRRILRDGDSLRQIFLETWTPASGVWADDVARDAQWLAASVRNLKQLFSEVIASSPAPPTARNRD